MRILVDEILSPFYIFQVFSILLWMIDEYYIYATSILVITCFSMVTTLLTVRSERKNLQKMVEKNNYSTVKVTVYSDPLVQIDTV